MKVLDVMVAALVLAIFSSGLVAVAVINAHWFRFMRAYRSRTSGEKGPRSSIGLHERFSSLPGCNTFALDLGERARQR